MNAPVATIDALVACWESGGDGGSLRCRVVPSADGARLFRRRGREGFLAAISEWAARQGFSGEAIEVVDVLEVPVVGVATQRTEAVLLATRTDEDGGTVLELCVPFDLAIFRGHFPTVPIVPGAMLVGWAATLAARYTGWRHGARAASALKFRRIVQPGQMYFLRLADSGSRLDFRYESTLGLHATGSLRASAK